MRFPLTLINLTVGSQVLTGVDDEMWDAGNPDNSMCPGNECFYEDENNDCKMNVTCANVECSQVDNDGQFKAHNIVPIEK